ncbi:MAG: toxin-antitoxin system TumE family protein [Acidithiobacillus sp.]
MGAKLLYRFKEVYGHGVIEGAIWDVPAPLPPSEHRVKYRLVYIVNGHRLVGYDNERGKGDHKHIRDKEFPYVFQDVATLIRDFMRDAEEVL